MNNLAKVVEPGTDIVMAVQSNPSIVLLDIEKFDVFYEKLKAEAPVDADVTTTKGKDALRKFAASVRSEKASIDKARLRLTKEWRDMTSQANEAGKIIERRLEALAVEVRKPLTDWEEAEKDRIDKANEVITWLKLAAVVTIVDTAATVRERGMQAWQVKIDADLFGDLAAEAMAAKELTVAALKEALARLEREEAERAELHRLRDEAAAREQADRIAADRAAAQAALATKDRLEKEARERDRLALEEDERRREQAEADRIERAKEEAAEQAQRDAEAAAQKERDRIQREHDEALAAERHRAEEAERAAQIERDRVAAEKAEAQRLADEQAERDANQRHRTAVKTKVKQALMTCGADEETARKIVLALQAGEIPHTTLRF